MGFVSLRNMQEHGVKETLQVVVIISVSLSSSLRIKIDK